MNKLASIISKEINRKSQFKKMRLRKRAERDTKVSIFLTNLGKYNEGELVGEWVDLPVQDFKPILKRIGIDGKKL